ncbi:transcriptional regulator [Lactococcus hodotermopsidis]|uniref:Transcriptional regulator n=1 Tax=Pseudolactococcus hodotermopsidis TaxID=2709157 RepID=A0A6A0BCQ8_9LACT|nr:diacylglycerol kinase family protein [Lactococcus hodotermopsidis]GFH43172.1 transcriptional regulator [Lactococcus hodotermopsidis]
MNYYILANPHAGHGHGKQVTDELTSYLTHKKITFRLFETHQPFDENRLMADILAQKTAADRILIIGGDGTISLSVNALPENQAFSYIPAGSGNDFGRGLGISLKDTIATFDNIHKAQPKEIFMLNYVSENLSGLATNNFGIGLDAAMVDATNKSLTKGVLNKFKSGQLAYLLSALHVVLIKKPFGVTVNGVRFDKAFLFTMTNHSFFGGGIPLAPDAKITDSDIHLIELDRFNIVGVFALIPKIIQAKHFASKHVHHLVDKKFELVIDSDQLVQIDGEIHKLKAGQKLTVTTQKRTILK